MEKGGFSCALAGSSDTAFGSDEMRVGLHGPQGVGPCLTVSNCLRGRLLWSWIDSMRSAAIAAAVDGLKHHSETLVWDGARGHRGEMVRSVGLATIIQPPYSPVSNRLTNPKLPHGVSNRLTNPILPHRLKLSHPSHPAPPSQTVSQIPNCLIVSNRLTPATEECGHARLRRHHSKRVYTNLTPRSPQ